MANDPYNWTDPSGLRALAPKRMAGTATVSWLILSGRASVTIVGGLIDDVAKACLNSPGCKGAVISGVKASAQGVYEALGVKPLPGQSAGSGTSAPSGSSGLGGATIGLADATGGALADLAVKMQPDDVDGDGDSGGDSGGGDSGGDDGDEGGGDDDSRNDEFDFEYDWTDHAIDEMMDENISPDDVYDAIENPVHTRPGDNNTTVFEGTHASAAVGNASLSTTRPRIVTVCQ